jgi:AcrR family transcriptional regulator
MTVPAKARLDRAAVVQAAAELVDAEGLENLTLAALAARLGIRTPSLYNHVTGLDGLRRDLALHAVRELQERLARAASGKAGDAAIVACADAYRTFAHAHPGRYAASLRAPAPDDAEFQVVAAAVVEIIVAVLAFSDLHGDDAVHAVRALRSILHGFVALEAAGGFELPLNRDESYRRLVRVFIDGLRRAARQP